MFDEHQPQNSLDIDDLILAYVALAIPPVGLALELWFGGATFTALATVASTFACVRLIAGGTLLGSSRNALLGGGVWLGFWYLHAWLVQRPLLSGWRVLVGLAVVLLMPFALMKVWRHPTLRRDDRSLALCGIVLMTLGALAAAFARRW